MIVVTSVRVERKTFENSCKTRRMDSDSEMTTGQQMDADFSIIRSSLAKRSPLSDVRRSTALVPSSGTRSSTTTTSTVRSSP